MQLSTALILSFLHDGCRREQQSASRHSNPGCFGRRFHRSPRHHPRPQSHGLNPHNSTRIFFFPLLCLRANNVMRIHIEVQIIRCMLASIHVFQDCTLSSGRRFLESSPGKSGSWYRGIEQNSKWSGWFTPAITDNRTMTNECRTTKAQIVERNWKLAWRITIWRLMKVTPMK